MDGVKLFYLFIYLFFFYAYSLQNHSNHPRMIKSFQIYSYSNHLVKSPACFMLQYIPVMTTLSVWHGDAIKICLAAVK